MAPPKKKEPEEAEEEDIEMGDEEVDEDYGEEEEEEDGFDLGAVLEPFLATEDGQTICTALVTISKHMEMQNKILVKILTQLSKKDS